MIKAPPLSFCTNHTKDNNANQIIGEAWIKITLFSIYTWHDNFLFFFLTQIAEEMKPSPLVISVLSKLSGVIPTWRIIPGQDIIETAFKQPEIRKQVF